MAVSSSMVWWIGSFNAQLREMILARQFAFPASTDSIGKNAIDGAIKNRDHFRDMSEWNGMRVQAESAPDIEELTVEFATEKRTGYIDDVQSG